ncbi:MAG TPA: hypothetical protein VI698_01590 [Nitrososphaerales archaeon]|nr:hypothetical protein [Nitrososphaerales archaeon]
MLESRVLRNSNEFNIPSGKDYGYGAMYFGVNLILMLEYKLSFDVNVIEGDDIEVLIVTRKDFQRWKNNDAVQSVYQKKDRDINDVFIPVVSDSYVFILNNRYSDKMKKVNIALTHTWKQEIRSQDQG